MEYNKYKVKLTDKTEFDITPDQYERLMEQSATGKDGVLLNGDYVTFKSIYGISGFHDYPGTPQISAPVGTQTKNYDLWIEATNKNKQRIKQGIRPYINWRVTAEGELIEDPEYYNSVITGGV